MTKMKSKSKIKNNFLSLFLLSFIFFILFSNYHLVFSYDDVSDGTGNNVEGSTLNLAELSKQEVNNENIQDNLEELLNLPEDSISVNDDKTMQIDLGNTKIQGLSYDKISESQDNLIVNYGVVFDRDFLNQNFDFPLNVNLDENTMTINNINFDLSNINYIDNENKVIFQKDKVIVGSMEIPYEFINELPNSLGKSEIKTKDISVVPNSLNPQNIDVVLNDNSQTSPPQTTLQQQTGNTQITNQIQTSNIQTILTFTPEAVSNLAQTNSLIRKITPKLNKQGTNYLIDYNENGVKIQPYIIKEHTNYEDNLGSNYFQQYSYSLTLKNEDEINNIKEIGFDYLKLKDQNNEITLNDLDGNFYFDYLKTIKNLDRTFRDKIYYLRSLDAFSFTYKGKNYYSNSNGRIYYCLNINDALYSDYFIDKDKYIIFDIKNNLINSKNSVFSIKDIETDSVKWFKSKDFNINTFSNNLDSRQSAIFDLLWFKEKFMNKKNWWFKNKNKLKGLSEKETNEFENHLSNLLNSLNIKSIKELQSLVGTKVDGYFGPKTLEKTLNLLNSENENNILPKENDYIINDLTVSLELRSNQLIKPIEITKVSYKISKDDFGVINSAKYSIEKKDNVLILKPKKGYSLDSILLTLNKNQEVKQKNLFFFKSDFKKQEDGTYIINLNPDLNPFRNTELIKQRNYDSLDRAYEYRDIINKLIDKNKLSSEIPVEYIMALGIQETAWKQNVVYQNNRGVMQINLPEHKELNNKINCIKSIENNIDCSLHIISDYLNQINEMEFSKRITQKEKLLLLTYAYNRGIGKLKNLLKKNENRNIKDIIQKIKEEDNLGYINNIESVLNNLFPYNNLNVLSTQKPQEEKQGTSEQISKQLSEQIKQELQDKLILEYNLVDELVEELNNKLDVEPYHCVVAVRKSYELIFGNKENKDIIERAISGNAWNLAYKNDQHIQTKDFSSNTHLHKGDIIFMSYERSHYYNYDTKNHITHVGLCYDDGCNIIIHQWSNGKIEYIKRSDLLKHDLTIKRYGVIRIS